ncbi:hypothetical protein LINGRAHAP2_LOCUS8569 [Linum grandiflorum]
MQSSGNLRQGSRRRESRQTVPRSVEFAGLGKPRRLPGEVLGSGRRGERRRGIRNREQLLDEAEQPVRVGKIRGEVAGGEDRYRVEQVRCECRGGGGGLRGGGGEGEGDGIGVEGMGKEGGGEGGGFGAL